MSKKIICIDFDGVLHSYESGWKGADVVADRPVLGAIAWLSRIAHEDGFKAAIYSARSSQDGGIDAMKTRLFMNGLSNDTMDLIDFPTQKPHAFLTIDDRCIQFTGEFPDFDEINNFKPWNKKDV